DIEVLERRLDGRAYTGDISDGGSRSYCKTVAVTHAMHGDAVANHLPVKIGTSVDFDRGIEELAAKRIQLVQTVDRQYAAIPEGAFEGGVSSALLSQTAAGENGVVADRFLSGVGKLDSFLGSIWNAHRQKNILEAHQTQTDWTMAQIGVASL